MDSYNSNNQNKSELKLESSFLLFSEFKFISILKGGIPLSLSNEKMDVKSSVLKTEKRIIVEIIFSSIAKEGDNEIFSLSAGYSGTFKYEENITPEIINTFAKANAPAIIYPFLRACIASLTLAAGVPPLTLPILNFAKFPVVLEERD